MKQAKLQQSLEQVQPRRYMRGRLYLILAILLTSTIPYSSAQISKGELVLNLSCISDDECFLSTTTIGEELISGQVQQASPLQPKTIAIEFPLDGIQSHIAQLPQFVELIEIDLRMQGDLVGLSRPALSVTLVLGPATLSHDFQERGVNDPQVNEPYRVEDVELDKSFGNLIWPDDSSRLQISFEIDHPGTWELRLRGVSSVELEIPWSDDPQSRNVDEPSSDSDPSVTEFDAVHAGALVESDRDCWIFDIERHEIMTVIVEWEEVPSELVQPHSTPEIRDADGRQITKPDSVTKDEDGEVVVTNRWRGVGEGEHTLCIGGVPGAFQPYRWRGILSFEGSGPSTPVEFSGDAKYPTGLGAIETNSKMQDFSAIGGWLMFASLALLIATGFEIFMLPTRKWIRGFVLYPAMITVLMSGLIHPMWVWADEVQRDDEMDITQLIDSRLSQLWDVSHPGIPEQTRAEHMGATLGLFSGDYLRLRLEIDGATQLPDGRWQLHIPAMEGIELDRVIFSKIAQEGATSTEQGLLDDHIVNFILTAARSLVLDLMLLEAILVVDEFPESNVVHIEWKMEGTRQAGSISSPAWSTKPDFVTSSDWTRLQTGLFPNRIAITLCDCELDLLEVEIDPPSDLNSNDIPPETGVKPASGPVPEHKYVLAAGAIACLYVVISERKRRKLAESSLPESIWY